MTSLAVIQALEVMISVSQAAGRAALFVLAHLGSRPIPHPDSRAIDVGLRRKAHVYW